MHVTLRVIYFQVYSTDATEYVALSKPRSHARKDDNSGTVTSRWKNIFMMYSAV